MTHHLAAVVVVEGTAVVVSGLDEVGQLRGGAPGRVLLHPGEAVIAAAPAPAPAPVLAPAPAAEEKEAEEKVKEPALQDDQKGKKNSLP